MEVVSLSFWVWVCVLTCLSAACLPSCVWRLEDNLLELVQVHECPSNLIQSSFVC